MSIKASLGLGQRAHSKAHPSGVKVVSRGKDPSFISKKISSREFNQDTGKAKKAAQEGPVVITDRGKASHVLLSIEDYNYLSGKNKKINDLLACPDASDLDYDPPVMNLNKSGLD